MENLWKSCDLAEAIQPIDGVLYRLVESQEHVATMQVVDNLEEQSLLEQMLDAAKPPSPAGSEHLHYLLYTPFRYPPLKHGSRYGARHEPPLFYGALAPATVLAEAAYYRLVFWEGMEEPPSSPIHSEHTLFSANYATNRGLRLHGKSCAAHHTVLTHPADYRATQKLGGAMREVGVEAFEFPSARCAANGINAALFTPAAFATDKPQEMQQWFCETEGKQVVFSQVHARTLHRFKRGIYLTDGKLPWPAE